MPRRVLHLSVDTRLIRPVYWLPMFQALRTTTFLGTDGGGNSRICFPHRPQVLALFPRSNKPTSQPRARRLRPSGQHRPPAHRMQS